MTLRELPVRSAAVYVPGGRAPYPSTAVMGVVTARAAGVMDVVVCSPPGRDGQIDPLILGTCRLLGVERVYRMGGAQAIAALAYGTETVARVDVIVGPGNVYVQEAKRQLSRIVGIDGFAGPSDLVVVLGEDADTAPGGTRPARPGRARQGQPRRGDLALAGALDALARELERLAAQRPEPEPAACVLVQSADAREAMAIANEFAPEHLQLVGAERRGARPAGALAPAVCSWARRPPPRSATTWRAPTTSCRPAGAARFASGLSPRHFRRRMAEVRIDEVGARPCANWPPRARRSPAPRASSGTRTRWRRAR